MDQQAEQPQVIQQPIENSQQKLVISRRALVGGGLSAAAGFATWLAPQLDRMSTIPGLLSVLDQLKVSMTKEQQIDPIMKKSKELSAKYGIQVTEGWQLSDLERLDRFLPQLPEHLYKYGPDIKLVFNPIVRYKPSKKEDAPKQFSNEVKELRGGITDDEFFSYLTEDLVQGYITYENPVWLKSIPSITNKKNFEELREEFRNRILAEYSIKQDRDEGAVTLQTKGPTSYIKNAIYTPGENKKMQFLSGIYNRIISKFPYDSQDFIATLSGVYTQGPEEFEKTIGYLFPVSEKPENSEIIKDLYKFVRTNVFANQKEFKAPPSKIISL